MQTPPDTLLSAAPPGIPAAGGLSEVTIPATPGGVRSLLEGLKARLVPMGLAAEIAEDAEIVLAEILNNVVEHAYSNSGNGSILVRFELRRTRFMIEITDRGCAMPGQRIPEKRAANIDVDRQELPEGGFGWFLIHELVEELSYSRKDGQNLVRIGLRVSPAAT